MPSSHHTQRQNQCTLMPNFVVRKGAFVLKPLRALIPCVDETLHIGWDAFLVLDHRLHVLDSVFRGKPTKGDCPSIQGLDEDLPSLYKGV